MDENEIVSETTLAELETVPPIPVAVIAPEKLADADLSNWQTFVVTGLETNPTQILPQDRKRHRAVIIVNGTAGDYIIFGKEGGMSNQIGGRVYVGNTIVTESAAAIWIPPTWATTSSNPIVITVEDERYL